MRSAEYVFGAGEGEIARLLDSAVTRRPAAEHLLDRVGDLTGRAVLDVGCGPLGVLDLLAERVGPAGTVVGVDREPAMVAAARRVLDDRGIAGVRVLCGDIAALPLPDASFDLVHERLVLVNLAEAPRAVAEMVRVTRPGGWVALQEFDHVSLLCQPPHPAWDTLMAAWHRVRADAGMDVTVGRHLHGLLRGADLVDVGVDVQASVRRPRHAGHVLPIYLAELHRARMTTTGALTVEELDGAVADLRTHLADPGTSVVNPMLFQAWGRRTPALP